MNWIVSGPGGVNYRAHYGANNTFEIDIASWCYKWTDKIGRISGWGGEGPKRSLFKLLKREREFVSFNLGREFLSFSLGLREENDIFSR